MTKMALKIAYCVPPILVHDQASQCAAYFLLWFSENSTDHIRDVLKAGLAGSGGLTEEVEYWFDNCAEDASDFNHNNGYWDTEADGPWMYEGLSMMAIATEIWDHAHTWRASDFALCGATVKERGTHLEFLSPEKSH
jgi:hypothetical protein